MLFKLSLKNMKKSIKDYTIYFITLVLGVSVFYMFNSLDSQQAMLEVSSSTKEIIKLMINMLNIVSIFIAVILGLLIVYANKFLINRRKKEFGTYMLLGMNKKQISKILIIETVLVGLISLIIGLILGIFASQFMSILVAKLFEVNMTNFKFVFSISSTIKTCIYFTIMYLAVLLFNTLTISKYKLIDLINASKKNEKIKVKNPIICIIVFIVSSILLGYAYWIVTKGVFKMTNIIDTTKYLSLAVLLGILSTIFIFWSISGLILKLVQNKKNIYLKDTNMFILRQLHNKINTTIISMSVICIMLFMTITVLSSSLSLKYSIENDIKRITPVDVNIYKSANLNGIEYSNEAIIDSQNNISYTLNNNGFNTNKLKDIIEVPIYELDTLTWKDTLGNKVEEIQNKFPMITLDTKETIMKISDYNKVAKTYNNKEYTLNNNEYMIIGNYEGIINIRNIALKDNSTININGIIYKPKYNECKNGFVEISTTNSNTGIILVPDNAKLSNNNQKLWFMSANYNVKNDKERKEIEDIFINENSDLNKKLSIMNSTIKIFTKINLIESSIGISTLVIFISIYLGIIFLIVSSSILALKELTESTDNKERYKILRKIGCDEKLIKKTLFIQIGIFFILPLILAVIHSIFGVQFTMSIFETLASKDKLLPSIICTILVIILIYGCYFLATYLSSINIIKEEGRNYEL